MVALILFIVFGLVFSYFATLNTDTTTIHFGIQTLSDIPIYIVILASVGFGVIFASLFHFIKSISYQLAFGQRNKELSKKNKEIAELTKEIHELEIENTKLKTKNGDDAEDDDSI